MYTPESFAEDDPATLSEFIRTYNFATLISVEDERPTASHLPLLLDAEVPPHGQLSGHLARANQQWKGCHEKRVLTIFHGPHAYISPRWMETDGVVPTWNYVAVHVYGTFRVQPEPEQLRRTIQQTVSYFEHDSDGPWSMDALDPPLVERLLKAVVGFTIEIESVEGKWKLNQNHSAERREKIIRGLRSTGGFDSEQIAELMVRTLDEEP